MMSANIMKSIAKFGFKDLFMPFSKKEQYDVVVIGGGATGSGIALDATLRGFKVLLIEKNDFSEGSSSRSTKLVHGGVRYLEEAIKHFDKDQYHLVKEGLRERKRVLNNASHLAHPITLLTPLYSWFEVPYIYLGLILYDIISGKYRIGKSSIVAKDRVVKLNPSIKKDGLKLAVKYYDGAFNDARMNIALVQSAEQEGAIVKNYTEFKSFIFDNDKIVGVKMHDRIKNKEEKIYAKHFINATGVFSDNIRKMADKNIKNILRPSSGIHIVVDKKFIPSGDGLMIPKTKDGRVLFMLPYLDKCLIGTTDNESKVKEHPKVNEEDIEYLLEHINRYFDVNITKKDILCSFCGLRPLVDLNHDKKSAKLVREHIIEELECGLTTIVGGKWTTYRSMAEEVVSMLTDKPCKTIKYKLVGSHKKISFKDLTNYEIDNKTSERIIKLYGDNGIKIALLAKNEVGYQFLSDKYHILKAELLYTIRYEYVKKPLDFIVRRANLGLIDKKESIKILQKVNDILANELKYSAKFSQSLYSESITLLKRGF